MMAIVVFTGTGVVMTAIEDDHGTEVVFTIAVVVSTLLLFTWVVVRGGRRPMCTRDHVHGVSRRWCSENHGTELPRLMVLVVLSLGVMAAIALAGEPLGAVGMVWLPLLGLAVAMTFRSPPEHKQARRRS